MSLQEIEFKSYPKIPAFGYDGTEDILDGDVVIQPKIDGSNVAVWLWNGEYRLARRNGWIDEKNDNSFRAFIEWFQNEWENNTRLRALADALEKPRVYFGEFSNNQNKLKYTEKVPFVLFDVADVVFGGKLDAPETYFDFYDSHVVSDWADTLAGAISVKSTTALAQNLRLKSLLRSSSEKSQFSAGLMRKALL